MAQMIYLLNRKDHRHVGLLFGGGSRTDWKSALVDETLSFGVDGQ